MFLQGIFGATLLISLVASQAIVGQVGFTAVLVDAETVPGGQIVRYKEVRTNQGNAYDYLTGIFTAPKGGFYVFQVHALSQNGKEAWLKLFQNDQYISSIFSRQTNDYDSAGNTAVLKLKKGDKVYVKAHRDAYLYGAPDDVYNSFSGYLVGLLASS